MAPISRSNWLGALLALAPLVSCQSKPEEKPEAAAVAVKAEAPRRGTIARLVEASGTLEALPGNDVKLGAPVAGRLHAVRVAPGDAVKAGQLLAVLELTPLRDALQQAQAQLSGAKAQEANARIRLDRARQAVTAGVAARQEVDDAELADASAKSAVNSAAALVSTASNQMSRAELRAPFAGSIANVFAAAGEPVDQGKPIVEVARVEKLELQARLSASDAALLRVGQPAAVRVAGTSLAELPGVVVSVSPALDPATGTALARVRVTNPEGALKLGSPASARIAVASHQNALLVPRAALVSGEGTAAALEVVEGGKAKKVEVELGYGDAAQAEVTSGLDGGEQVIVQGAYALPDGTPVRLEGAAADAGPTAPEKR